MCCIYFEENPLCELLQIQMHLFVLRLHVQEPYNECQEFWLLLVGERCSITHFSYLKQLIFFIVLVIYHHGKYAAGGHYTAAVHHGNPFGWVHFDDNLLKTTSVNQVLKHQQGSVPYLLFYERVQTRWSTVCIDEI